MKKLILIIGAPGSGKTTDANLIAERNSSNTAHFSTGDLLREEVATGSDLGKEIDALISKGNLVSTDIVVNTILSAIERSDKDTIIIDGYPRSVDQMITLDGKLSNHESIELLRVIEVEVSKETAFSRVMGRGRGADDNAEVFENRMKVFYGPIEDIRQFYTPKGLYHTISGERTIEEIVDEMDTYINNIKNV